MEEGELTGKEKIQQQKRHELRAFNYLKWGHLITFLTQQFIFVMKQKDYYNLTQFLQGIVVPLGYMSQILYALFTTKLDLDNWENEVNYIRAWLYIECTFFLSWIICGMIFLFFAYIFKFKSVAKDEKIMQMDDNVWNDKNTDDFLRYLKFEFFVLNYMMSFLFTDLMYGFQIMSFMSRYHHSLM